MEWVGYKHIVTQLIEFVFTNRTTLIQVFPLQLNDIIQRPLDQRMNCYIFLFFYICTGLLLIISNNFFSWTKHNFIRKNIILYHRLIIKPQTLITISRKDLSDKLLETHLDNVMLIVFTHCTLRNTEMSY